ncbi:hypothetical protein GYMLUDRAFT_830294 [Collybiopsis luxurians FD-317 M1]|uniref:Uncharacterized protein n=1 Tax=Collybiopsis luxurians FD-317 M1 TaxID=944289 RepID=A0A0D0C0M0_9AGAR|nr:hypothetical protein GYMLUDRAFT_830294 [Collybiopsis luxurians FD-317 M1]
MYELLHLRSASISMSMSMSVPPFHIQTRLLTHRNIRQLPPTQTCTHTSPTSKFLSNASSSSLLLFCLFRTKNKTTRTMANPATPPTILLTFDFKRDPDQLTFLLEEAAEVTTDPADWTDIVVMTVVTLSPSAFVVMIVAWTEVVRGAVRVLFNVDETLAALEPYCPNSNPWNWKQTSLINSSCRLG